MKAAMIFLAMLLPLPASALLPPREKGKHDLSREKIAPVDEKSAADQAAKSAPPKRFTGRRIDFDFKNASIHKVLRVLGDVGQVNIVASDAVTGTITIKMRETPWDRVLDVIAHDKQLTYVRKGNTVAIDKAAD